MGADVQDERKARGADSGRRKRLSQPERREQILVSATTAFVRAGGFSRTGLDDVAAEAGITRMILYRHFDSKTDLFRTALDRAALLLHDATTDENNALVDASFGRLLEWAAAEPAAFRLLFRCAPREPEFHAETEHLLSGIVDAVHARVPRETADGPWTAWAARMANTLVVEGIVEWLEVGGPDPERAAEQIVQLVETVLAPFDP